MASVLSANGQNTGAIEGSRAELLKPLSTRNVHVGDKLFLKASADWEQAGCRIRENTTLEGEVVSLNRAAGQHKPVIGLRFQSLPCAGNDEAEVWPVLIALQSHPQFEDSALRRLATARQEDATIAGMFSPSRPGIPTSVDTLLTSANVVPTYASFGDQSGEMPLKTGEVVGLRGVSLELPTSEPVTVVHCTRDLTFEGHETTFMLTMVPRRRAQLAQADPDSHALVAQRARIPAAMAPREREVQEAEVCAAAGCRQASLPTGDLGRRAEWTFSLGSMSYEPHRRQAPNHLGEDASVHFLGQDQLLVTFPLHNLIKRSSEQQLWATKPRQIRAVLLSRSDGHVLDTEDWTVSTSDGPFLWNFDGSHVLAQIGSELVSLGPGLVAEQRVPLHGPLLFLSMAPQGEQMLVATLHETHTAAEHKALASYMGPGRAVDEDYDLTALDGHLNTIGTRLLYTPPIQPALFRSAMVTVEQGREGHWQVVGTEWTGKRGVLARLSSSCPVQAEALPGNRAFLRGCNPDEMAASWFRVLDSHGATMLQGSYGRLNLWQDAESDPAGRLLAIATSRVDPAPEPGASGNTLDVSVLDLRSGKAVFATHLPTSTVEHQILAFSPEGNSLAVVADETLHLYPVDAR